MHSQPVSVLSASKAEILLVMVIDAMTDGDENHINMWPFGIDLILL